MKKRAPLPSFIEAAAPVFPLWTFLLQWDGALETVLAAAVVYLAVSLLFELISPAFPKNLLAFAKVLTVCSAVYALPGFYENAPAIALSVCLLEFPLQSVKKRAGKSPALAKIICFAGLAVYLAAAQEILGRQFHWPVFQRVPGTFFLLSLPAVLWPVSRKRVRALRTRIKKVSLGGAPA